MADPRVKMHDLRKDQQGAVIGVKIEEKSFEGRTILQNVEFKIRAGERILISGPNGSGKTTLLRIMAGKDTDFKGQITIDPKVQIGYLSQFSSLDSDEMVIDQFSARTHVDYTICRGILAKYLFPAEYVEEKIKNLSFGQQRRLELAILLTNKPDLLLLDEPTNHLDIFLREDLETFLIDQEVAMCVISHDRYFLDKIGIEEVIELK